MTTLAHDAHDAGDARRQPHEPAAARRRAARQLPLLLLAFFLALGTYVRVADLGRRDFGVDELFQVYAAQGLMQGEGPVLPSGTSYTRGIDVTRLMRHSFAWFGVDEVSARMPSAAFGLIGLFLFAAVLHAMAGGWVAVVGTALFAVYPEAVQQSREVRFYTYQLLFGIAAFYTGWRSIQPAPGHPGPRTYAGRVGWALATMILLLAAFRVQLVTMSVWVGYAACVLFAAGVDAWRHGKDAWRRSVPLQLSIAGLLAGVVVLLVAPGTVLRYIDRGTAVPSWVLTAEGGTSSLAYYYSLSDTYPLLLALLPLLVVAAVLRQWRLAIYCALWYAVPLVLHSFVLAMKGARFVLIPNLGLFTFAAIATVAAGEGLYGILRERLLAWRLPERTATRGAVAILAVAGIFAFVTLPAFSQSRKLPGGDTSSRWSATGAALKARPELAGVPVGTSRALHPHYYWGRLDFVLGDPARDDPELRQPGLRVNSEDLGGRDNQLGAPILTTAEEIRQRYATAGAVIIGIDPAMAAVRRVDPELARLLAAEADELCGRRCAGLLLYHWRFDGRASVND